MEKEDFEKTERLFELLKKKGTLRGFDDKKREKPTVEIKEPEELATEEKVPTIHELMDRRRRKQNL